MTSSRQLIRQYIRQARNALTSNAQYQASIDLINQVNSLEDTPCAQNIALYLATDGELDTQPLIEALWHCGKHVYLPVIHPFSKGHLLFLAYKPDSELCYNRYGIIEPRLKKDAIIPVADLDIIFTPLVAFDQNGQRLGMGGGYYDRTLAPFQNSVNAPKAIGLAHDCQKVDSLPSESWDIPLEKIVTPSRLWQWES
ncbi:5-formyltetrahydrofolate cyclo-ligase [Vibrio agarivorans]|uniref:5-formyltetrahydrofolate cyclo-ligase n=1 Tax=Vibrio agarivorans TaxID=153622 RepID=UPI0025B3DF4C|nr:5-formyltetrahydrofolate cyclo-ligase [Vibrio agarivorans]MDN3661607.1 5-formyltetrahydrofolate cyclo-ligase [Vibrio agarivorans]